MLAGESLGDKIAKQLFEELRTERKHRAAGLGTGGYERAFRRLRDFLVDGICPDEFRSASVGDVHPSEMRRVIGSVQFCPQTVGRRS